MKNVRYIFIFLLLCFAGNMFAQDFPKRPDPPRLVNDLANLFTPAQTDALERKLVAYNDSTSTQISVVTISDLKGYDITDFTDRLAIDWKVGQKGINNGLMILIVPKRAGGERGYVRISVGYGLEQYITDAISSKIVNNVMIPDFRLNKYYSGVDKSVDIIAGICSGQFKAEQIKKPKSHSWIFFLIPLFILFIASFIRRNRYSSYGSNGSGSGAPFIFFPGLGGGGGGFGNSGGSDFGGFGGFGGGDFGGGGSSGSW